MKPMPSPSLSPTRDRLFRLRHLSTLALAGLVACGGGGSSGDTAAPAPVAATPTPAPAPAPGPAPSPTPSPTPAPTPAPTPSPSPSPSPTPAPPAGPLTAPTQVSTVASGLDHPWGLAFLPDGRFLVTERPGRLRLVSSSGTLSTISGVPTVLASGQGGLLDVAIDPAFATNRYVYFSYAESGDPGTFTNGLAVARGVLSADASSLSGVQVIYRQLPKVGGTDGHFGGRIVFAPDGKLFITMGDRQNSAQQGFAQDLSRGNGKIARINPDGTVPADNPFVSRAGAQPALWSYGHRNPQGAAIHPATGELWAVEHGPQGGDELNVVRAGLNYGWPLISYGCEYGSTPAETCTTVGGATSAAGMEQPITYWVPYSTAPSGLMFYTGTRFTAWRGKAYAGALSGKTLWQFDVDQSGAIVCTPRSGQTQTRCGEVALVKNLGKRIRDVRQGPDGSVYLLTDEGNTTDQLLRLQ